MRIEADLFSGRPNPSWTAGPEEARVIAALLAGLAPAPEPAKAFEGLGYRGMVLAEVEPEVHPCPRLRVAAEQATCEDAETGTAYADPDRELERRLVEMARDRLPADLYGALASMSGLGPRG